MMSSSNCFQPRQGFIKTKNYYLIHEGRTAILITMFLQQIYHARSDWVLNWCVRWKS